MYESTGLVSLMRNTCVSITIVILALSSPFSAQDGYFADWFHRVDKTQAEQPHWANLLLSEQGIWEHAQKGVWGSC